MPKVVLKMRNVADYLPAIQQRRNCSLVVCPSLLGDKRCSCFIRNVESQRILGLESCNIYLSKELITDLQLLVTTGALILVHGYACWLLMPNISKHKFVQVLCGVYQQCCQDLWFYLCESNNEKLNSLRCFQEHRGLPFLFLLRQQTGDVAQG